MAPLLPSEVARLVYGQLEGCNCSNVAERFLQESPHLEECREFVKRMGKPSFMTKAYGLSLQQILEQYLDMWNLILDQTNNIIPDTKEKFADPVDALKFLLSAYDRTSTDVRNVLSSSDDIRWRSIIDENNGTPSDFSLRLDPSEDLVPEVQNESANLDHSTRLNSFDNNDTHQEFPFNVVERNSSPQKLREPNRYLDKLHASIEGSENPGKKKTIKILKPRQQFLDRSTVSHSALEHSTINPTSPEDGMLDSGGNCYTKESVGEKSRESLIMSRTKTCEIRPLKRTNMQLRSSRKVADRNHCETIDKNSKVFKKRKCLCSPERVGGCSEQSKVTPSKVTTGNENDTQVDFTKIPQLLMNDPKWPELIAENINKKIMESPKKKIDTLVEDKDKVIQSIAEKTLQDDLTDEFIRGLLNCAQTITQEKNSATSDISLLDDNPYVTNSNCESNVVINEVPENVNVTNKPMTESSSSNNSTYENANYARLHDDMNEFVRFNNHNITSDEQPDIIVIEMAETEQISTSNANYVMGNQSRSLPSNYVVCSTQETPSYDGNNLQNEIYTVGDANKVEWSVQTNPSITISAARTNASAKLQICGPVSSPSKSLKRLRPLAPKPNVDTSVVTAPDEKILPNKPRGGRKPRK